MKKKRKTNIQNLRNKADGLCTPVSLKRNPNCLLCGKKANVGHHFIKKSEANILRYDENNLCSLCTSCHCALHSHETLYTAMLIKIRGMEWANSLLEKKRGTVKTDRFFYEEAIDRFTRILQTV